MKKYIRCHIVEAEPMTRSAYNNLRGITPDDTPNADGYHVVYPDGYESWCPKEQFEKQGFLLEDGTKITEGDIRNFKLLGYQEYDTHTAPNDKPFTMVQMVYPTGFTDFATSACVDPKNYSEDIGLDICIKKINDRLWGFLGFMLQWAKDGLRDVGMEIAKRHDAEAAAVKAEKASKQPAVASHCGNKGGYYGDQPWMYSLIGYPRHEFVKLIDRRLAEIVSIDYTEEIAEKAEKIADDVAQDICDTADADNWSEDDLRKAIGRVLIKATGNTYKEEK